MEEYSQESFLWCVCSASFHHSNGLGLKVVCYSIFKDVYSTVTKKAAPSHLDGSKADVCTNKVKKPNTTLLLTIHIVKSALYANKYIPLGGGGCMCVYLYICIHNNNTTCSLSLASMTT